MKKQKKISKPPTVIAPLLSKEKTSETRSWSLLAELHGVEVNGSTYYYSRPIDRYLFGSVYDHKQRKVEVKLKPNYFSKGNEPDMYLYIRPYSEKDKEYMVDTEDGMGYVGIESQ